MPPTAAQLSSFLRRLRAAARSDLVYLTAYALDGARDLGWDVFDVRQQLVELSPPDFLRAERSTFLSGETVWVFQPTLPDDTELWIRLIERHGIVVVSFHLG